MDGGFVLVVAKRPTAPHPARVLEHAADDLGFAPSGSATWSDAAGRLRLWAWAGPRRTIESVIAHDAAGASFVVGDVRRAGESWPDPTTWPTRLGATAAAVDPQDLMAELRGVYIAGGLDRDGTGWLLADPLGLRCVYVAEDAHRLIVGSRAALVARQLAGDATPAKDVDAVTWLAFTSHWVGQSTGFEGVSTVEPGLVLRIDPDGFRWERSTILDAGVDQASPTPVAEVVPGLIEDIADSLRAALARPASRHILQLTGGRDSRLLLAVALAAGIADQFTYVTSGPDNLADVRVAGEMTNRFGLEHEIRFFGRRPEGSPTDNTRAWVHGVGGMVSAWDGPGSPDADEIRVTGVCGEVLRSFRRFRGDATGDLDSRRAVARLRPGRLGLLADDLARRKLAEMQDAVRPSTTPPGDPRRELHLFYARNRMRFTRLGPRQEVSTEERILPLYSPVALEAALTIDGRDRQDDVLCLQIIAACAPQLVHQRFAGKGWGDRANEVIAGLPDIDLPDIGRAVGPSAPRRTTDAPPPVRATRDQSLVSSLVEDTTDERALLVADAIEDASNPIWGVIDLDATRTHHARWTTLDLVERRELLGAVTAAIWAGSSDAPPAT